MKKQETSPQRVGLCLGSILRELTISKSLIKVFVRPILQGELTLLQVELHKLMSLTSSC